MGIQRRAKVYDLILCALFAALIAVGAFIKIPIPPVPFTLQIFFAVMAGIILGPKRGPLCIAAYILLGLIGVAFLWSIREIREQARRVERGWFPKNPNRK